MNIHEYQAKELLAKFGVAVPRGGVAYSAAEAVEVARRLGGPVWVVKAQIHAGGRGKAGGVKLARSEDEVATAARVMLGQKLVTHQTGPEGREVKRVYVEEGCDIARELYLGLLIDRVTQRVTLIGSTEGGVEIEEVAAHSPEKILTEGSTRLAASSRSTRATSPSASGWRAPRSVLPSNSSPRSTARFASSTPRLPRSTRWSLPSRVN